MNDPITNLAERWRKSDANLAIAMTALLEVVEACHAYLPPDGIEATECISRVLAAIDNPRINPLIASFEIQA